ncbi:PAS domain-containing protein [Oceanibacterium hippocampi]|uniref:PAS domain protein n=1 Tax=Oceanibacterium hippocampi TaxID=745714 RepID=A0A1Y5S0I7_9PROT|nr:PAS domain-containing protein [Oceanibacterium hippocampi]SLN29893.1 PAS domain protein [Oceanibacterium hippocampi]
MDVLLPPYRLDDVGETDERLVRFLGYWVSLRDDQAIPRRQDFRPEKIAEALPSLTLVEIVTENGCRRFRFRVVGSRIEMVQAVTAGDYIDDVASQEGRDASTARFARVLEAGQPVFDRYSMEVNPDRPMIVRALSCPLSRDGTTVSHIVTCAAVDNLSLDFLHRPRASR